MSIQRIKKILALLTGLILLALIGWLIYRSSDIGGGDQDRIYKNSQLGFVFQYPEGFTLSERQSTGDKSQPIIIDLHAKSGRILFVPSIKTKIEVETEKKFYENILFSNPDQTTNVRILFDGFEGFKSVFGTEESLHTVYKKIGDDVWFVARTQINASSSVILAQMQQQLTEILQSLSFDP